MYCPNPKCDSKRTRVRVSKNWDSIVINLWCSKCSELYSRGIYGNDLADDRGKFGKDAVEDKEPI